MTDAGERDDVITNRTGAMLCCINGDGSTTYNWDAIATQAAKWAPYNDNIATCVAKLLLPFKPKEGA